jgi:hypothetical protein
LKEFADRGHATLLDCDCKEYDTFKTELLRVIEEKAWEKVNPDLSGHSWEDVAREWLEKYDSSFNRGSSPQ